MTNHEKRGVKQWNIYPPRYKDENGRLESLNSYNTFLNHYLQVEPTPTIKQLIERTGFKEGTIKDWVTLNKFNERKSKWIQQQHKEKNKSIIETAKIINEATLNMSKSNVNTANGFIRRHRQEMKKYSHDDRLGLELLDIHDPAFNIISRNDIEMEKKPLRIQESVKNALSIDTMITEEADNKQALDEAMERNNLPRFKDNLKSINQAYEDTKDEPF